MNKIKTSVVMCTYNGELYIKEQMESLRLQTSPADEILFFDDCSSDNTVGVVLNYIQKFNLSERWRLEVNESNKGFRMNFLDGIMKATGDILYYCDQDDIWDLRKIEKMNATFENPDVWLCESTETRFSDDNADYRFANMVYNGDGNLTKRNFFDRMKIPMGSGHLLAFRKEFRDLAVPVLLENDLSFDISLVDIASVYNKYYVLGENLVQHRVYSSGEGNASKPMYSLGSRVRDLERQIASRSFRVNRVKVYRKLYENQFDTSEKKVIDDYIQYIDKRIEYMKDRRFFRCLIQTFHYNRMNDFAFTLIDLLTIIFGKSETER